MAKSPDGANHPVHTVRHRSLKATIWRNVTDKGVLYNVIVTRSYRDKASNQWHDTHSIGYDDLMNVAALMYEAHAFISGLNAKDVRKSPPKPTSKSRPGRPAPPLSQADVPF